MDLTYCNIKPLTKGQLMCQSAPLPHSLLQVAGFLMLLSLLLILAPFCMFFSPLVK